MNDLYKQSLYKNDKLVVLVKLPKTSDKITAIKYQTNAVTVMWWG